MTVAFHAWNPFQIYQILPIAEQYSDSVILLEARKSMDRQRVFGEGFFERLTIPIQEMTNAELRRSDGLFEAIVVQTPFKFMEEFSKTKIIGAQYSMTKERHQYGAWRSLCDLNLVYGKYSHERIQPISPARIVGNPRFDPWFSNDLDQEKLEAARANLDPAKKTLLYLPTWGDISSVPAFQKAIGELHDRYNLLIKVHHNTDALELERKNRLATVGGTSVFGAADDTMLLLALSDLVLSDYSGAIFDAINVEKPVVLLQQRPEELVGPKFGLESIEFSHRNDIGPVVHTPKKLAGVLENFFARPGRYARSNARLRAKCFGRQESCGEAAAEAIDDLLKGRLASRPWYQLYVRDELRKGLEEANKLKAPLKPKELPKKVGNDKKKKIPPPRKAKVVAETGAQPIPMPQKSPDSVDMRRRALISSLTLPAPIYRLVGKLLDSKSLIALSKDLSARGQKENSIKLARLSAERKNVHGHAHLLAEAAKYGDLDSVSWVLDHCDSKDKLKSALNGPTYVRAAHFLERNLENIGRAKSAHRTALMNAAREVKVAGTGAQIASALFKLRYFEDVEKAVQEPGITPFQRRKWSSELAELRGRSGGWFDLIPLATQNELLFKSPSSHVGVLRGAPTSVHQAGKVPIVEFQVGTYLANDASKSDPAAHARICKFQVGLLDALDRAGILIVPRHQYWLAKATPTGYWPAISYHTLATKDAEFPWLHLKDSAVPDLYRFDEEGYAGWSSLAKLERLPEKALNAPLVDVEAAWTEIYDVIVTQQSSKYKQSGEPFKKPELPFVFFPLQILDDTVAKLSWVPMLDAMEHARKMLESQGKTLVIKRHPLDRRLDVMEAIERFSKMKNVIVSDAPVNEIIPHAEAVLTVNSGVGFEALLYGSRVITLGASEYGVVTERAKSLSELERLLANDGRKPDIQDIKRYVWLYRNESVKLDEYQPIVDWILSRQTDAELKKLAG